MGILLLQRMLWGMQFSKSVYFWSIIGVERPCHNFYFFFIKSRGQWFLYWLLPLICPHYYKRNPWLMLVYHFWSSPFSMVSFSSAQSWCLMAVWILYLWWETLWGTIHGLFLFERTLSCIYLLMFSSWECSSFVFVCVCVCVCVCVFTYLILGVRPLTCSR